MDKPFMDNPLDRLHMVSDAFEEFAHIYQEAQHRGVDSNHLEVPNLLFFFQQHLVDLPDDMESFLAQKMEEARSGDSKPVSLADAGITGKPVSSWEELEASADSEPSR